MFDKKTKISQNFLDFESKISEKIAFNKKSNKERKFIKYLKYACYGILGIVCFFIFLLLLNIFSIKSVISNSVVGKNLLMDAASSINSKDFTLAYEQTSSAKKYLDNAQSEINRMDRHYFLSHIPIAKGIFNDARSIVSILYNLNLVANESSTIASDIQIKLNNKKDYSYSEFTKSEREVILSKLNSSTAKLIDIKKALDDSLMNINDLNTNGFWWPFRDKINELKTIITQADNVMDKLIPLTKVLPKLSGYPKKSVFLVMLQNSDELRPSGGFLGTYGILEMESGDITRFDTHDIYHMDMPSQDNINETPPTPIKKYLNEKWYMRDANWSPDWPTAAQKIEYFYHLENQYLKNKDDINKFNSKFDGIIGVTPDLVKELIGLVGDITIEGQTYTKNNFTELLEYRVEKGYTQLGVPKWERKEVIGDIMKVIKQRIMSLPVSKWGDLIEILDNNILNKNIQIYLTDNNYQKIIQEKNWSGEIKDEKGDYLMIVDSNMASLKTDSVMKKNIVYNLKQTQDKITVDLHINYSHEGGVDWRTSRYKSYVRAYVPKGSKLLSAKGCNDTAYIGEEYGKTMFGCLTVVEPGSINDVNYNYVLPDRIHKYSSENKNYTLYTQKQAGARIEEIRIDLQFNKKIKSNSPNGFNVDRPDSKTFNWVNSFKSDTKFIINF